MLSIGVITRGKYGHRLLETIEKYTDFTATSTCVPETLPQLIDEPETYGDDLDQAVLSSDLVITYSLHPDLTPEIVRRAGRMGAKAVIIPGGRSRAGDPGQLRSISAQYNIRVLVEDICCAIGNDPDPTIDGFASRLGLPHLHIEAPDNIISSIKVIRGAPCGSTWWMAAQLTGTPVEDAPARAGLLVQQYPCRAERGAKGGIHRSAQLHKNAVASAIKKYHEKYHEDED